MTGKREGWDEVRGFMESEGVTFGPYLSYWFEKTPRRALHYASYYKFAARMIGGGRRVNRRRFVPPADQLQRGARNLDAG